MGRTREVLIKNIKSLRKERHWSQLTLAAESDVSPGMIGEIETGKKNPSLETLDKIAAAFDIPTYRLLIESDIEIEDEKDRVKQMIIKMISES